MSTNTYTNAKVKLRGTQTLYTAPSAGTSIVKSIRVTIQTKQLTELFQFL